MIKKYIIPKKFKRLIGVHLDERRYLHYELIKIYKNFVLYRCIENNTNETFLKTYFLEQNQKIKKGGYHKDYAKKKIEKMW